MILQVKNIYIYMRSNVLYEIDKQKCFQKIGWDWKLCSILFNHCHWLYKPALLRLVAAKTMLHLRTLANLPFFKAGSWRSPDSQNMIQLTSYVSLKFPQGLWEMFDHMHSFHYFFCTMTSYMVIYGLSQRYLRICVSMRLVCSPPFAQ